MNIYPDTAKTTKASENNKTLYKKNNDQFLSYKESLLAKINECREDIKWSQDADRSLITKNLRKETKRLNTGQSSYKVCLYPYQSLPSRGKKHFSAEERHLKLAKITQLPEKYGVVDGGCSLVLFLFQDYYQLLTLNLLKELLNKRLKPTGGGPWSKNKSFMDFHLKFGTVFGSFNFLIKRGGLWRYPISVSSEEKAPIHHESCLAEIANLKNDQFLKFISAYKLPSAQPLNELIDLLEDCAGQDLGVLFNPLSPKVNHSAHFERLKWRIELLKTASSSLPETLKICGNTSLKVTEQDLFKETISYLLTFSETLHSKISKPPTFQAQREMLHFLLEQKRCYLGAVAVSPMKKLLARLSLDLSGNERIDLYNLSLYLLELQDSLFEEGTLTCLLNLLSGMEEHTRVCAALKDTLATLEDIQNRPRESISQTFEILSQAELNPTEKNYFASLEGFWEGIKFITTRMSGCNIDLLRYRLEKCLEPTATNLERAHALKDVQIHFGVIFKINIQENLDNLKRFERTCSYLSPVDVGPELHALTDTLSEMLEMNLEAIHGTVAKINFMLNEIEDLSISPENQKPLVIPSKKRKTKNRKKEKSAQKIQAPETIKKEIKNESICEDAATSPKQIIPQTVSVNRENDYFSTIPAKDLFCKNDAPIDDLAFMRTQLKTLAGATFANKEFQQFFDANLRNIKHLIRHLEETGATPSFSLNTIFGETDALRQLMEGVLELGMISTTPPKEEVPSPADQISLLGHQLHRYVKCILNNKNIPKNVRRVVLQNRAIPYYFSQANACVNYLNTTHVKHRLPSQAKQLLDFLSKVRDERQSKIPNPSMRETLLKKHQQHKALILSFTSELLLALANPSYMPEKKESFSNIISNDEEFDAFAEENARQTASEEINLGSREDQIPELQIIEDKTVLRAIPNREDALNVIESALIWLRIRSLPPVEGGIAQKAREMHRNQAFENVRTYLLWLAEKLQSDDYSNLYDTSLEEMKLMRRAHKELAIGVLYHGNYFKEGQHIIDAYNLRYKNNPCFLNNILLQHSSQANQLPNLNHPQYMWMSAAHQGLSYPELQWPMPNQTGWDKDIRKLVNNARKYYRLKSKIKDDFILVKNKKNWSRQSVQREIKSFVQTQENEKVFTALSALLQIIVYGMPAAS